MKSLYYPHPHLILPVAAVLTFLLTACAPQAPLAQAEVAPSATPTATATAVPTLTPTATLPPTATATPTPTPVTLPVTNGTPIPDLPYEVITAENVSRLRQIARYGYARLLDENPATYGADGFIRVWAVVPEDAPVK